MNRIYLVILLTCFQFNVFAHKPYNELQINPIDLTHYPKTITHNEPGVEVTIGDLHGNALKLIYFLIANDVLAIAKEDYEKLVAIYQKPPEQLSPGILQTFHLIIDAAIVNTQHRIRFLGDDLCDRGMNDYYTLYLYKKLDVAGVPFEIILSNHNHFFLDAYERPNHSFSFNPYGEGKNESLVQSMLNLGKLIQHHLVKKQDILDWVQTHYLKHIAVHGYTLNKLHNELTIYSHAPIDLAMTARLARDLNIPFRDGDLAELLKSLGNINTKVREWIMTNTFTMHYNELKNRHKTAGTPSPLEQILWNRDYTLLNRAHHPAKKAYGIIYVHGHDSMANVVDLDTTLGKGNEHFQGPYAIYVTH
jgi:hypothetical protein